MKSIALLFIVISLLCSKLVTGQILCNSDFDCSTPSDTLCSKFYCLNGVCAPTTSSITTECCSNTDCEPDSDMCRKTVCAGGVFSNGTLIQSPTCQVTTICCLESNYDNFCEWPLQAATWNKSACAGQRCDVLTWGSVYAYPLNTTPPDILLFQPRYYFRQNWASLFKKLIIVELNVMSNYGLNISVELPEIRNGLTAELDTIETYLLSSCDVWKKALTTCATPAGIPPSNFQNFADFYTDPRYDVYDTYLTSILSGKNISIPLCNPNTTFIDK